MTQGVVFFLRVHRHFCSYLYKEINYDLCLMFIFCNYITIYLLLCSNSKQLENAVDGEHDDEEDVHCPAFRRGSVFFFVFVFCFLFPPRMLPGKLSGGFWWNWGVKKKKRKRIKSHSTLLPVFLVSELNAVVY